MTYMIPTNKSRRTAPQRYNSVSNMIDEFFGDMYSTAWDYSKDTFKLDVQDKDNLYLIEADLPGVNKDEISLELEENVLKIQVKREESTEDEKPNYIHKERKVSSMSRSLRLKDVKSEEIDAKLENGVLSISVPKVAKADRVKQININ